MRIFKIPMLLLKLPVLLALSFLQAVLNILDRFTSRCTGLLTLVLAGFWIHHCILGNRDNLILLSVSLALCIVLPVLLRTSSIMLERISEIIS